MGGLDLRLAACNGFSFPNGCHIGVRIGDLLKQGRYEPERCYHFPKVEGRKNARIDLFQHIGSAVVSVEPGSKASQEVLVTSTHPTFAGTKLEVTIQDTDERVEDASKKQRQQRAGGLKEKAKHYLIRHKVEEKLADAVKALLKEEPSEPFEFLCRYLSDGVLVNSTRAGPQVHGQGHQPANSPVQVRAESKPAVEAASAPGVDDLRLRAGQLLMQAAEDGTLRTAMAEVRAESKPATEEETLAQARTILQKTYEVAINKSAARAQKSMTAQMRESLVKAADDGTLEQETLENAAMTGDDRALDDSRSEGASNKSLEETRETVVRLLEQTSNDGSLETALKELVQEESSSSKIDIDSARKKAAKALIEAEANGILANAISEAKLETSRNEYQDDRAEIVRGKTQQAMLQALGDGSLEQAIAELKMEEEAALKKAAS